MRNLTELALKNRSLVWYFVVMIFLGGIFFYQKLGRMEDPAFTIRQMVVSCIWAGATAEEMELQVTDKLEKTQSNTANLGNGGNTGGIITPALSKISIKSSNIKLYKNKGKFTVTVKDSSKKPEKKLKIYFSVNGKKYKKVTNSKGKATLKLK